LGRPSHRKELNGFSEHALWCGYAQEEKKEKQALRMGIWAKRLDSVPKRMRRRSGSRSLPARGAPEKSEKSAECALTGQAEFSGFFVVL